MLRREPREVYRVFSEEDFLAGADVDTPTEPHDAASPEPRRKRIAVVGIVLGGLAAVALLLAGAGSPHRVVATAPSDAGEAHMRSAGGAPLSAGVARRRPARRQPGARRERRATRPAASAASLAAPSGGVEQGSSVVAAAVDGREFGFER
jgi:hypothetical protein